MRIIYFLPDIDAGVSRIVKNLLRFRPDDPRLTVTVVLFACEGDYQKPAGKDFKADEVIRFSYTKNENAWAVFKRMATFIKSDDDIIVGNDGFEIKMVAALQLNNRIVYIQHGDFSYYYSIIQQYHSIIDTIIAYSNKIERTLKEMLGETEAFKVQKIYYPIAKNARPLSVNNDRFRILFAGSLIERKGADMLPGIFRLLKQKGVNDFDLEVIGDGELMGTLQKAFDREPQVKLSGWQSNEYVIEQMQRSSIFLFPSRLEGLPNVLLEALEAGAVPVSSNLESGVSDIILHEQNGLLAETGNEHAFASAIKKIFDDHSLLKRLKINASEKLSMFDAVIQAEKYQQCIIGHAGDTPTHDRVVTAFKKGRLLDIKWLPNWLVILLRKIFSNPKL